MTDVRSVWLAAVSGVVSHRRMYAISTEIAANAGVSHELRKAAQKVVRVIDDVIELPIANSRVLAKASRKFAKLVAILEQDDDSERTKPVFSNPQKIVGRCDSVSDPQKGVGHHCFPAEFRHVFVME